MGAFLMISAIAMVVSAWAVVKMSKAYCREAARGSSERDFYYDEER